ncbi:MAG: hypothetical protein CMF50_03435 [Legionellales bacterium]|nr:hypothetical protein [Legionellales bacterium]|tara:strand:- start:14965 stop:15159 length:195 start_codon:yes stop_codon:yes gene_type:complete
MNKENVKQFFKTALRISWKAFLFVFIISLKAHAKRSKQYCKDLDKTREDLILENKHDIADEVGM